MLFLLRLGVKSRNHPIVDAEIFLLALPSKLIVMHKLLLENIDKMELILAYSAHSMPLTPFKHADGFVNLHRLYRLCVMNKLNCLSGQCYRYSHLTCINNPWIS